MRSRIAIICIVIVLVAGLFALLHLFNAPKRPDYASEPRTAKSFAMGTTCSVSIYQQDGSFDEKAFSRAISAIQSVDEQCSLYDADSDISRVNASAAREPVEVRDVMLGCLRKALECSELSGGLFNPAIRPVLKLWGFGPGSGEKRLPEPEQLMEALSLADVEFVKLQEGRIAFERSGVALDLNGIAQGYATDLAVKSLLSDGIKSALVQSGGGEFAVIGSKWSQEPFRIGIKKPSGQTTGIIAEVALEDTNIAISGDYVKFFEVEGQRFSHLIDPRTGMAKKGSSCTIAVLGPECAICDGLATAVSVLEPEEALDLISRVNGYEVIIARMDEKGPLFFHSEGIERNDALFTVR
ncbi:MAG: FAD:protein FMN transferase [Planctomycetota bacterium]|nr:FAD:protein FMN transferase [Planctomycetota bacterium]